MRLVPSEELLAKWGVNAKVFLAPLALIYLPFVTANIQLDGIQLSDFQPNQVVIGAMVLYVMNIILDWFKKVQRSE